MRVDDLALGIDRLLRLEAFSSKRAGCPKPLTTSPSSLRRESSSASGSRSASAPCIRVWVLEKSQLGRSSSSVRKSTPQVSSAPISGSPIGAEVVREVALRDVEAEAVVAVSVTCVSMGKSELSPARRDVHVALRSLGRSELGVRLGDGVADDAVGALLAELLFEGA